MQAEAEGNRAQPSGAAQRLTYGQHAPVVGFLAKVAADVQFAPLVGRSAGQSDSAQYELVQFQVFGSEQVQELHESAAKSLGAHEGSLAAPAVAAPAAPDQPALPIEPAASAEPTKPALPAVPASFIASAVE